MSTLLSHTFFRIQKNPTLLIGALILFVAAFGLCGIFFPSPTHLTELSGECGAIVLLGNSMNQRELVGGVGFLILLFVIVLQILPNAWEKERFLERTRVFSLVLFRNAFFQTKIFHPLLRAFRKGILHSQIYNFAFVAN